MFLNIKNRDGYLGRNFSEKGENLSRESIVTLSINHAPLSYANTVEVTTRDARCRGSSSE